MSFKIKVKKHDRFRALMSDVLPYETPMIFSNHGLYNYIKDITDNKIPYHKGLTWLLNSQEVGSSKSYTVNVAKPNGDKREFDALTVTQCSKPLFQRFSGV